jgi:transposase
MKIDARKISTEAQQEKRNTAKKLRKKRMACKDVSEIIEVNHTTIARWYAKYKREGNQAIKVGQRGKKWST